MNNTCIYNTIEKNYPYTTLNGLAQREVANFCMQKFLTGLAGLVYLKFTSKVGQVDLDIVVCQGGGVSGWLNDSCYGMNIIIIP